MMGPRKVAAWFAGILVSTGLVVAGFFPHRFPEAQRSIRCTLMDCWGDPAMVVTPTSIDFASLVQSGAADTRHLPAELKFDSPSSARYLPSGWNPVRQSRQPGGETTWTRNTQGPAAVVEVPIAHRAPLTVMIDAAVIPSAHSPRQYLTFLWNDEFLFRTQVAENGRDIRLSIPVERQNHGLNTLTLLPHFWLAQAGDNPDDPDTKPGVQIRGFRFQGAAVVSSPAPATVHDGSNIRQGAGTTTAFYLSLPDAAVLRGSVAAVGEPGIGEGTAVLALKRDGEEEKVLGRWTSEELKSAGAIPLSVDLAAFAGEWAALSLSVSGRDPSGAGDDSALRVEWQNLRIAGSTSAIGKVAARKPDTAPNVVVVLFDTLRADFTEPIGGREARTPNMNRLAAKGVTFVNATSNASSTRPSVATLLTGLVPTVHNVNILESALPAKAPYLPAVLQEAGYVTIGISDNPHISEQFGFARGFDQFAALAGDVGHQEKRRTVRPEELAAHTWETAVAPTLAKNGSRPFFLYLHEIDPHFPYDAPPPFDSPRDFGYRGALLAQADTAIQTLKGLSTYEKELLRLDQNILLLDLFNRGRTRVEDADIRYLRSRYAAEVSYMDAYLGWVMNKLVADHLDKNTLFVFVSDHGEEFFEHGFWTHGPNTYRGAIHVPLIASMPGVLPTGVQSKVHAELVDVVPTILDLAGVARPALSQGRSLVPHALATGDFADGDPAFAVADDQFVFGPDGKTADVIRGQQMVQVGPWKLLRDSRTTGSERGYGYALYNLDQDPEESVNLWASRPVTGNALKQALEIASSRDAATTLEAPTPEIDETTRDQLRALGYLQ